MTSDGPHRCMQYVGNVFLMACACLLSASVWAVCPANLGASSTPTSAYFLHGNGTVSHYASGLMWKQCNEGRTDAGCATGSSTTMSWAAALSTATASSFAGFNDWRLPNKQELQTIVDAACESPSLNTAVFPGAVTGWTWTGTTLTEDTANAWVIDFNRGFANADRKSGSANHVRLVRGGSSFDRLAALQPNTLNIDNSDLASRYDAATDGLLLMRYLSGLRGAALIQGALGGGTPRTAAQIEMHISTNIALFDVDLDGSRHAMTDGLMILRRLLGLYGSALTAGAKNSARSDIDIQNAIDALKP